MSRPRLGFIGVGWIGLNRLQAVLESGLAEVVAVADPSPANLERAAEVVPQAYMTETLDALLRCDVDGVVIATPSALHAAQTMQALEAGCAVFCQKPLARTAAEHCQVIETARRADRLLGIDMSYRFTKAVHALYETLRSGQIGDVFAVDLVFHNAYGPDKPWYYDRSLSGGGCLIDLGIHLIDLALWCLDTAEVRVNSALLRARGQPVPVDGVEDYASVHLTTDAGTAINLVCSWNLPAGCDAIIEASFYGTGGGLRFRNVDGGFYNFAAHHLNGTQAAMIAGPPDDWGGRAVTHWVRQLGEDRRYRPEVETILHVASAIDQIYEAAHV